MKDYKAYKMVVSSAVVFSTLWKEITVVIAAENEEDARDYYNPAVTGMDGSMHKIISCELVGDFVQVVDEKMKSYWRDDGN